MITQTPIKNILSKQSVKNPIKIINKFQHMKMKKSNKSSKHNDTSVQKSLQIKNNGQTQIKKRKKISNISSINGATTNYSHNNNNNNNNHTFSISHTNTNTNTHTNSHNQQQYYKSLTSHQLRIQFLQSKLSIKTKRLQSLLQNEKHQQHTIQQQSSKITELFLKLQQKQKIIQCSQLKIKGLEVIVAKQALQIQEIMKQLSSIQLKSTRDHHDIQYSNRISKTLTKENHCLVVNKKEQKEIINQITLRLEQKTKQIMIQRQNNKLLNTLNEDLKLQVESLMLEIRVKNRRQQTDRLYEYEREIQSRTAGRIKKITDKYQQCHNNKPQSWWEDSEDSQIQQQSKQNMQNNYVKVQTKHMHKYKNKQNTNQKYHTQSKTKQKINKQQMELVQLLKHKIKNLQQQLSLSDTRCKQLQTIVLSQ